MNKYFKLLSEVYDEKEDLEKFKMIMREDGLGDCKPIFHLKAFIFGWFYLLYKRAYMEAFGVIVAALMMAYVMAYAHLHPILVIATIFIVNSLLSGFCYYFLYLNKFNRDVDNCGEYNTDMECLRKKTKPSFVPVIVAVVAILFLLWPIIFKMATGANISG